MQTFRCAVALLVLFSLACCASAAQVRMFDSRVDVQQITEVRVDVPEGHVITGLGFRAHEDNLTTMLCRYSRVTADGRLVEPMEKRVGSEPDHACETLVLLPEGYVAVGFGGRGAPEWDITTLRVWARKLLPGGKLGEVEVFEDGSAPKQGCEREILLRDTDRALTGAGLRFHFNDIIGIYAASSRIAKLSAADLKKRLPLAGWIVDEDLAGSRPVVLEARKHLVRKVYTGEQQVPADTAILDAAGRQTGRGLLPEVRATELAGAMASAALEGATRHAVWVSAGDTLVPGTVNDLNLAALRLLANDPFISPQRLWSIITRPHYGKGSTDATSALQWAASAGDLIFKVFGLAFQSENGRILTYDESRAKLAAVGADSPKKDWAEMLLSPTDSVVDLVQTEKDTSFWAIRIATASARAAVEANPGPATHELEAAIAKMEPVARLWQAVANAFIYASMYGIDGAPQTRSAAERASDELLTLAREQNEFTGAEQFARSLEDALSKAETGGPIAVALNNVSALIDAGEADEAVQALSDILTNPAFAPHLDKRNESIAALATRLAAIWKPDNLRVLRGGDGTWMLTRAEGKWAFENQDDSPCVYLDVTGEPLDAAADYVLSFEYFDTGTGDITLHYDSEYETDKQYHPGGEIARTDTKTWKTATLELKNTRLTGGQNMLADMRLLGSYPLILRNMSLRAK